MTTGYQRPRTNPRQGRSDGQRHGAGPRQHVRDALIDLTESELAESYQLPGAELAADELEVEILAQQADEFTCGSCFLVRHRTQLAKEKNGNMFCRDCEG